MSIIHVKATIRCDGCNRKDNVMTRAPANAELLALADEYEDGLKKCAGSGYEEYGPGFQRRQQMIIDALRFSALRASPRSDEVRAALRDACGRLQQFLDTFGDIGDCATAADLNDWCALAKPAEAPTMINQIIEVDGCRWRVNAKSMKDALNEIGMARSTGSTGSRTVVDSTLCGGSIELKAEVQRLDDPQPAKAPARCQTCGGDGYINRHENLPDDPCPACNKNAPTAAERMRVIASEAPVIAPIESAGLRGAKQQAINEHRSMFPAEAPAGVREVLIRIESDLRSYVKALGEGDDLGAVLLGCANDAAKALSAQPARQTGREVSDDRAMMLALRISSGQVSAVQGAVEIMHYATDAIEQERQFSKDGEEGKTA
jgi:hypothetical protein